tara:strand:- start:954 stop:1169 length:216 start_codon:yes stop_codon:yes gene_type:complete
MNRVFLSRLKQAAKDQPLVFKTLKNNINRNYKANEKLWRDNTTNDLEAIQRIKDAGNLTGCLLAAAIVAIL